MALPISNSLRAALARPTVTLRNSVDVLRDGAVTASTDDLSIKVRSGGLSFDSTRDIECEAGLQLLIDHRSEALVPLSSGDPLSPIADTRIRLSFGAQTVNGVERLIVATLEATATDIYEVKGGVVVNLDLHDGFRILDRARFTSVRTIEGGLGTDAIVALIRDVLPAAVIEVTPTTHAIPIVSYEVGDSRLGAILDIADSIGYLVRYTPEGNWSIVPDTSTDVPDWTFVPNGEDGLIYGMRRSLTDEGVYNGVVVRGESFGVDADPVQAEAWDTDPNSPTYYDPANPSTSSYGPVPYFMVSEYITTVEQAQDAAVKMLSQVKGLVESLEMEVRVNPAMQTHDACQVLRDRVGTSGRFEVQAIEYGLLSDRMRLTMRERRI